MGLPCSMLSMLKRAFFILGRGRRLCAPLSFSAFACIGTLELSLHAAGCRDTERSWYMGILLFNIALMALWAALFNPSGRSSSRRMFTVLCTLQWVLIAGLRAHDVGADTGTYEIFFYSYMPYDLGYVVDGFMGQYFGTGAISISDAGYYLLMKLFQLFSSDYQVWLLFQAVAFFVPMGVFIHCYSKDPLISWLVFSTVFYTFFAFSAVRQALALSIAVFVGYHAVRVRRPMLFLILILIAFTIHKSALVFAPLYILYSFPFSKRFAVGYSIALLLLILFGRQAMSLVGEVFEEYAHYSGESYVGSNTVLYAAVLLLFSGMLRWRWRDIARADPEATRTVHALACSLTVIPLAFVNSNAFRAVFYYMIFLLLLLPSFTSSFPKSESTLVGVVATALMLAFMLFLGPVNDGAEFRFFWM